MALVSARKEVLSSAAMVILTLLRCSFLMGRITWPGPLGGGGRQGDGQEGQQLGRNLAGQHEVVQAGSQLCAVLCTVEGGSLLGVQQDVINSAGVVLNSQLIAVVGVRPGQARVEGVQMHVMAVLLMLPIHGTVG